MAILSQVRRPVQIIFDSAHVAPLANPLFGLEAYDRERAVWNEAFEAARDFRRYSPASDLTRHELDAYRRGYAAGLDTLDAMIDAEEERLAEGEFTLTRLPWDISAEDMAEARMALPAMGVWAD